MSVICAPSIWIGIKNSTDYKTCNSATPYLIGYALDMQKMCSIKSCKSVLDAVASAPECSYGNGLTNKDYACDVVRFLQAKPTPLPVTAVSTPECSNGNGLTNKNNSCDTVTKPVVSITNPVPITSSPTPTTQTPVPTVSNSATTGPIATTHSSTDSTISPTPTTHSSVDTTTSPSSTTRASATTNAPTETESSSNPTSNTPGSVSIPGQIAATSTPNSTTNSNGIHSGSINDSKSSISSESSSGAHSHTTMYIGIGSGIAVLLCAIFIFCVLRRRKVRRDQNKRYDNGGFYGVTEANETSTEANTHDIEKAENGGVTTTTSKSGTRRSSALSSFIDSQFDIRGLALWRINPYEIEIVELLGSGAFGEVWLGIYMSKNVAVKKLLGHKKTSHEIEKFVLEIQLVAKYVFKYLNIYMIYFESLLTLM